DVRRPRPRVRGDARRQRAVHAECRRAESEAAGECEQRRRRLGGGDVQGGGRQDHPRSRAPAGDDAAVREVRPARGRAMSELGLREFHWFQAGGREFAYLVRSAAVFELDETARAVVDRLREGATSAEELVAGLEGRFAVEAVEETIRELVSVRA